MLKIPSAAALALGLGALTLGAVVLAEAPAPPSGATNDACAVAPPADQRGQQQTAAAADGGSQGAAGRDAGASSAPAGAAPPAANSTPVAVITLTGSNLALALPTPCPAASPVKSGAKITKSRSNIQNN